MAPCIYCQGSVDSMTRQCRQCRRIQPPTPILPPNPGTPSAPGARPPITIFISYSHADAAIVLSLQSDLKKQGIYVWLDHERLPPGTQDWEEALRRGLQKAQAVVLIASPNSRQSRFVRDELRLAESYKRPVYPLWVAGVEWIDSIPMGWGATQYSDARGAAYGDGVRKLVAALVRAAWLPPDATGALPQPGPGTQQAPGWLFQVHQGRPSNPPPAPGTRDRGALALIKRPPVLYVLFIGALVIIVVVVGLGWQAFFGKSGTTSKHIAKRKTYKIMRRRGA